VVSVLKDALLLGATGSVTVDVANRIGREIMSGRIPQGATLPNEADLCTSFDVGRSAVREAVKMLTAKGMVQSRPRRGTQVLPAKSWNFFDRDVLLWLKDSGPDLTIIIELLELRLGVEPRAAGLAAEKATTEQRAAIRSAYASMEAAAVGKADPVIADGAFHDAIITATNNRFFQPFGAMIRTALVVTAPTTNAIFGHSVGDLDAHGRVLAAIEASSSSIARDAMERMLSEVLDAVAQTRSHADLGLRASPGRRVKPDEGKPRPHHDGFLQHRSD
jgi:DNA-binding FadR family transcriptional regulator